MWSWSNIILLFIEKSMQCNGSFWVTVPKLALFSFCRPPVYTYFTFLPSFKYVLFSQIQNTLVTWIRLCVNWLFYFNRPVAVFHDIAHRLRRWRVIQNPRLPLDPSLHWIVRLRPHPAQSFTEVHLPISTRNGAGFRDCRRFRKVVVNRSSENGQRPEAQHE